MADGPKYDERKPLLERVQDLRGGRKLVTFFNFDRASVPQLAGLSTVFHSDVKEALFRVLKELATDAGLDICLYTRGGDTNAVWPVVNLLREFDSDFEVLVPFRCHSSGTLVALGARHIWMGPLSELSPIDPSTGNQFNPTDPGNATHRLAISVEDVQQYADFVVHQLGDDAPPELTAPFLRRLVDQVHPLALGNVHRTHKQIKQLARDLLLFHADSAAGIDDIVKKLTTQFYSHLHMIGRHEALDILGADRVSFADEELSDALDALLRGYEERFALRRTFILTQELGNSPEKKLRFVGAALESESWSYLHETCATVRQHSKIPQGVQVQVPAGQPMPLVQGLPWEFDVQLTGQGWVHNKQPRGVTA